MQHNNRQKDKQTQGLKQAGQREDGGQVETELGLIRHKETRGGKTRYTSHRTRTIKIKKKTHRSKLRLKTRRLNSHWGDKGDTKHVTGKVEYTWEQRTNKERKRKQHNYNV